MIRSRREFLGTAAVAAWAPAEKLNFVFILADDLGYGDLGCYGSERNRTPALDRLARDGARLTNHYSAAPVCSPARAGLLTGMIADRTGITGVMREEDDDKGLPNVPTIGSVLKGQGYQTVLIGKWHLGMGPEFSPLRRGFDRFWGYLSGTIDYTTHVSLGGGGKGKRVTYADAAPMELQGYFPELATAKAVEYIEEQKAAPFFLLVTLALPHTPLQVPAQWKKPFAGKMPEAQATYAGMVSCVDDTVAKVRAALERTGQWERTVVVFTSDNGWVKKRTPAVAVAGSNGELRGGKYELYEGGIRVPCIVRWPGVTRAGAVVDTPSWFPDWMPTLSGGRSRDGMDLRTVLAGKGKNVERELFWKFEDRAVGTPLSFALRRGDWKLLRIGEATALYDLKSDAAERVDVARENPKVAAELSQRMKAWVDGLP